MIRNICEQDAEKICDIYNYYIENTSISFETLPVDKTEMINRINSISSQGYPFLGLVENNILIGYAYLHKWHERMAFEKTAELSIYLDKEVRGKGKGSELMEAVLKQCSGKWHCIVSCITLPGEVSIGLHKKYGFKQVSCFNEVGYKFNKWHGVCHMQLILS